jgi:hypothetical protein
MAFSNGVQLSVELTRLASSLSYPKSALTSLINFARDLRKSGSDIIVEEDLANIFGRGMIVAKLEDDFKTAVTKDVKITLLHPQCEIVLRPGPAATVTRAMTTEGRRYLSNVIQLSFLGWMHDRADLASALAECMDLRMRAKLPDAGPHPGYEGILRTLESCNSQTSSFDWNSIIQSVDHTVRQHFGYYERRDLSTLIDQQSFRNQGLGGSSSRFIDGLSTALLLSAIDYLYIVQKFPEDRKILLKSEKGAIPVIVWAHKILGLNVVIRPSSKHPRGELYFGHSNSPEVIIHWRDQETMASRSDSPEILLLDQSMDVVLSTLSDSSATTGLETAERHSLENFGTIHLKRHFNQNIVVGFSEPVYSEMVQLILALVVLMSRKTRPETPFESISIRNEYSLDIWRIGEAARVIFRDCWPKFDMDAINEFIDIIRNQSISEISLPASITGNYSKRLKAAGHDPGKESRKLRKLVMNLAFFTFAFAHVEHVESCSSVPLKLCFVAGSIPHKVEAQFNGGVKRLEILASTLFFYIARFLVSHRLNEKDEERTILLSDFGWSLSFNCMRAYDEDPAAIKPWFLHLRRGIPTNLATSEQKSKIGDANIPDCFRPEITVLHRGASYTPCCKIEIKNRTEYFSSRDREFLLGIRFSVETSDNEKRLGEIYSSYRRLHNVLWASCVTETGICTHATKNLDSATLGFNVAAVGGCEWPHEDLPSRICIVMVRGDQQARWLALQEASQCAHRQAMIRTEDCCENCALDAVISLPGKWILII